MSEKSDNNETSNEELFEHFDNISQQFNQMKIEIEAKKEQLQNIRNKHDNAQIEKQKLEFDLEMASKSRKEMELKNNLISKKLKDFEQKYSLTKDKLNSQSIKYSEKEAENKFLKDALIKCQLEKTQIARKLEDFVSETACNEMDKNYIKQQVSEILATTNILKEKVELYQKDLEKLSKSFEEILNCTEAIKFNEFFVLKLKESVEFKNHFEKEFIFYKTKYEKLEELMDSKGLIDYESNFFSEQWRQLIKLHKTQLLSMQETINNLMSQLNQEKLANAKLIEQIHIKKKVDVDQEDGLKDSNKKESELNVDKTI